MRQRALVFIDMILDTRYGTLYQISETIADLVAMSGHYRFRHHDLFSEITNGQINDADFKARYAARDVETLFHSKATDFLWHLRQDTLEGIEDMNRGVQVESLVIDINIWPYQLDKRSIETIRRSVQHYIPPPAIVNMVRYEPSFLTPTFLDSHYEMVAIYDHEDWLGPNTDAVIAHRIPDLVFITPMLSSSGIIPEPTLHVKDPFGDRRAVLDKFIGLTYTAVGHVCYNPAIRQLIQSQRQQEPALLEHPPQEQT